MNFLVKNKVGKYGLVMVGVKEARNALRAYVNARMGKVVSVGEIVERGRVCRDCPECVGVREVGMSAEVSWLLGRMGGNDRRVFGELAGKGCRACGCSLLLKLPAREEDLGDVGGMPERCWVHGEGVH